MKNFVNGFPLSSRANRIAVSIAACMLFFTALQPEAFGQWKLASGFSNSFGLYNYDQADGFISWGDSLLAHAKCGFDNTQPGATADSLFLSTDHGQTWTGYTNNGVLPILIVGAGANAIFYANAAPLGTNDYAEVSYSTDGAQTWITDSTGLTELASGLVNPAASSMVAIGSNIYLSDPVGVYKQTSLSGTWANDNAGLVFGGALGYGGVGGLIASGNNLILNTGFAGLYLSTNGGSWSSSNNGLSSFTSSGLQQWLPAFNFAVSGSSVFAQVSHDLSGGNSPDYYSTDFYRSMDNGGTWTKMNSSPINNWGSTYGFTATSQALFTATDSGFYASTDNGATWTQHNEGLSLAGANFTNSVHVSGGNVVVGTQTSGAYYRSSSDFGGAGVTQSPNANSGLNLTLSENPASGSEERISYTLSDASAAQLMLMDELGRSVRMLQNGRALAGQNLIAIDPQSLAPGTYFVRVTTDGTSAMQKLVIER